MEGGEATRIILSSALLIARSRRILESEEISVVSLPHTGSKNLPFKTGIENLIAHKRGNVAHGRPPWVLKPRH